MMKVYLTQSYFDGDSYHGEGPYRIGVEDKKIQSIDRVGKSSGDWLIHPFLMPGLTEAHCHLFLEGGQLDFAKRSAYLKGSLEEKISVGKKNLKKNASYGVTCLSDAGDSYGINVLLQKEMQGGSVKIRQAEQGIRKTGRYGGFLARAGSTKEEYERFVQLVADNGDMLKIVLTGIIDFESGQVKGVPQFSQEELDFLVGLAREKGMDTMVHCSGEEGLEMAVRAGVGSIEHGFFMKDHILSEMRDKDIAWVPTFIPVQFQFDKPQYAGWNQKSLEGLKMILDEHRENLLIAQSKGNTVLVGSDAGSFGVEHGFSLMEELRILREAGVTLKNLLQWATIRPREQWGMASHKIQVGNDADMVALEADPFEDFSALLKEKEILL